MKLNQKTIGAILIGAGVIGFLAAAIMSFTIYSGLDAGGIPGASIVFMMIGMCFYFPTLLEESPGQISTMRVVTFSVVLVFTLIYVKLGWNAGSFDEFKIDPTWVYILG